VNALSALERLDAPALRAVIASLLAGHPHLASDIERIVLALSARPTTSRIGGAGRVAAIARELEAELSSLDTLDLSTPRAEPWRYDTQVEDTWERLHRAVAPTVETMRQLVMQGHTDAALDVLQGILLALYRLDEDDRGGELLQGAPDFPSETATWAWGVWRKATRGRVPLPESFATSQLPSWKWLQRTGSANARRRRR
jgi:hypothetical protein